MIKIVQRQDIEDVITGNIDAVKSVVYYTHLMAAEDGIHPLIKREGDVLRCKLFSNQIAELITGNLICQVEIAKIDEEYPDREFNEIKKTNLNIWIKGKDPQDETLRVGYENLTIGLKQAVDKANTSVQPDDLSHYVNVEDFETQISTKVDRNDVYSKDYIDNQINTLRGEIPSTAGFATEQWVENKGYLTEHQQLKTINGETITGSGDIKVSGVGVKLANGAEVFNRYNIEGVAGNANIEDYQHGPFSHAEGYMTQSKGNMSHAEGTATKAYGHSAHAEGQNGEANGNFSHVEGFDTIANSDYSHAEGIGNKGDSNTIHEVGIGVYNDGTFRKNAHTITKEGLHYIPGVGGYTGVEKLEDVDDLATVLRSKLSLNDVYSKDEIDTQINTLRGEIPSTAGFATEQWVESKGYLTAHQDLSGYVEKSEITDLVSINELENSLKPYATEQWVESKGYLTEHQSLAGLATETWVETQISTKVDRNDVYSKEEVNTQINTLRGEIPSTAGFATETWVENKGYLTQHQDISGKLDSNSIWAGTAEEWELVTDKSQYIIALIK